MSLSPAVTVSQQRRKFCEFIQTKVYYVQNMARFCLEGSDEYCLALSDQPKRFDADSPVTNVFFDDSNGQVFTVRSGGVTGVTVNGMDESKSTSFRMEDRGPIISIKFSPDLKILAIQRNQDTQNATVEFVNFKDLAPTNVEYSHTCKWKNAKILGFVWPKVNEITFITDHGIELLQVLPEKKQLKSLKNTSFSCAWFSWCSQSNIVLLAGNNGLLLQPFSLNNSTITKLQKLELEATRPVVERDVFILRLCEATWCAVFRHGHCATVSAPGPTEVWLMPITGPAGLHSTHVLKTGLVGRFAVNVVDDLIVVHHQASQSSQIFDIMEESRAENNCVVHIPVVPGVSMKPALVGDMLCPMYSDTWVVFQPDYIIDARLGCLWRVRLVPSGLAHELPKDELSKIVAVLLRRTDGRDAIYRLLNQLVTQAGCYLAQLSHVFDEIHALYRKWAELEVARNTAGQSPAPQHTQQFRVLVSQPDACALLQQHAADQFLVQVVTAYVASLCRNSLVIQPVTSELMVRALVTRGSAARLRAALRRGALGDARALACALLSLGHLDPAAAQLALDMLWRLKAYEEVVEVLLSWEEPVGAAGAARQAGATWLSLPPRKLLAAARAHAQAHGRPTAFTAIYHALQNRNERTRGSPHFLKGEQCDSYVEYYKQITSEPPEKTIAPDTQ
nr:regulator of MON1-CCZ1 complex isoform X5 [Helicoverpa armigera]XP_049707897.1 regulator of MON1-CCZ1 complex isoform X6 [Helicoverpa armigera]XP_049707898.1 regulator of MON1-CCZ1 complex isoform X7 [Helicoverpa armigera]XP_049707899.1 regulator of MON1-CCZ1 complex isoform X8 [Helicoverpa armigera]XP_049707900.1 regulator of MON1-CCZ1 complex isoform X9 [Helicoverpa armigera]XP_049707901.1 regulator of MON1-CCZ1 complex isoform X10 [Helicoverpa armigera]